MYLKDYIESGVALSAFINLLKDDEVYIRNGGNIYYAVDVDVVKMYSDIDHNFRYAKIFPGDSDNSLKALTHALSTYIFDNKRFSNTPLFLLYPHNKELKRIIYAIMMQVADDRKNLFDNSDKIKNIFYEYSLNRDDQYLIDNLQDKVLELIYYLFDDDRSSVAELSKITTLLKKQKVISLSSYVDHDIKDLFDTINYSHSEILRENSAKWRDKLRRYAPNKDEDKLCIDAEVIARLEYINSQFALDSSNCENRLVLITGDSSIHNATRDDAKAKQENRKSFYDLYIRDPKVFLGATDLFYYNDQQSINKNDLADWVNVSLSGITDCLERHPECNPDVCKKLTEVEKIKFVRDKWNEYVNNNLLNYSFKNSDILEKMKNQISNISFHEIEKKIDNKISIIWIDCWKLSAQVGYWGVKEIEKSQCSGNLKRNREPLLPLRSIPALQLTYETAMNEVYRLWERLSHDRVINDLRIFNNLEKEDPSDYTAFLIYALAFGAAGKWNVACILSKIALIIADDPKRKELFVSNIIHEPIKGDEAAYLLAWSTRHTSLSINTLIKAKEYINDAKKRKLDASGTDFDMRYECESIAIDMAYYMYYFFLPERIDLNYSEYSYDLKDLHESKKLLRSFIETIGITDGPHERMMPKKLTNLMIRRQSITYYYFIIIILQFKCNAPLSIDDLSFAKDHLHAFDTILNTKKYKIKSFMNYIIYLVSELLFSQSDKKISVENELKDLLGRSESYCVMPYDFKLYDFFKSVAITGSTEATV